MKNDLQSLPKDVLERAAPDVPKPRQKARKPKYTTIRLTSRGLEALKRFKEKYGMSVDAALEHVIPDELDENMLKLMKAVSHKMPDLEFRKSVLVSPERLDLLRKHRDQTEYSRDNLINLLLMISLAAVDIYEVKRMATLNVLYADLTEISENLDKLEIKARESLGEDDPVALRFGTLAVVAMNLHIALGGEINDGVPVDGNEM